MVERWRYQDVYYNWLAYPNLHIASANGGYSFTLEHHIPIAPDRTQLEIYWFTSRKKQSYASSSQILLAQMHGSKADRKSTRLNSSHLVISYAVFCLKKKKES